MVLRQIGILFYYSIICILKNTNNIDCVTFITRLCQVTTYYKKADMYSMSCLLCVSVEPVSGQSCPIWGNTNSRTLLVEAC